MEINKEILNALQSFEDQFEHEFRIGRHHQNNTFTPGVSQEEFDRILGFIASFAKFKGTTFSRTVCYVGNYRKRTFFQENVVTSEDFIIKKKIKTIDLFDFNLRFSVSQETNVQQPPDLVESFSKNMERLTYEHGPFRIDFSIFNKTKNPDSETFFDVEIEILGKTSKEEVSYFIGNILKAYQKEEFITKISEKNEVLLAYKKLVKSPFYFGCQPLPLKSKLNGEYSVSLKLDGIRKLLTVGSDGKIFSLDSKNKVIFTGETAPKELSESIFDSELYKGIYYVFDVIFYKNKDLRQDSKFHLKQRLELVKCFAIHPRITAKPHHFPTEGSLSGLAKNLLSSKEFKNDGVIFTPVSTNYPLNSKDFAAIPLKWKKAELNTIDFHIKKKTLDDESDTWELYVIDDKSLVPFEHVDYPEINKVIVKKELSNLYKNESIVECSFDTSSNCFTIVKARCDKTKPNHISVALDNFDLSVNPFDLKNLEVQRKETYFFDMRRFHNYIKRILLDTYVVKNGKGGHLDLACGKGGDIFKWGDTSIRYVQGYDICSKSIQEANRRNEKFIEKPIYKNMDYNFLTKDLSVEVIETDNIFDSASCFFAIHYFFRDQASFYNLMKNTKQLRIGGYFMVSCFCSDKLEKTGYSINNSKFKINPIEDVKEDGKFGRKLNVFLQDTVLDEQTTEYIVDYVYFVKVVESLGFELVSTELFEEYYDDWAKNNNSLNSLSKMFSFLNRAFVFVKVSESDYVVPTIPKVKSFEFIDFCDTEGLEEQNAEYLILELKTKKIQELKEIASSLAITFDKKISKKSLIEAISAAKKL
jgi:mRNA (guanine-N7-)-methyltransferase